VVFQSTNEVRRNLPADLVSTSHRFPHEPFSSTAWRTHAWRFAKGCPFRNQPLFVGVEGPQNPPLILIAEVHSPSPGHGFVDCHCLFPPLWFSHGQEQILQRKLGCSHYGPLAAFHSGNGVLIHPNSLGKLRLRHLQPYSRFLHIGSGHAR
jgi:hypothetical protein